MAIRKNSKQKISGDLLLSHFQTAQIAIATIGSLRDKAEKTEDQVLENLNSISNSRLYLTPDDIPEEMRPQFTYASFNAHLQKIQAGQIEIHNQKQLEHLSSEVRDEFRGSKVLIKTADKHKSSIFECWRSKDTRSLYISKRHPNFIKGKITNINLEDNYLIIKPTFLNKTLKQNLQYYIVQVIDHGNFNPNINLTIV